MTTNSTKFSRRSLLAGCAAAAAGGIVLTACGSKSSPTNGPGGGGPLVMTVWGGDADKTAYQKRIDLLVKQYPEMSVKLQLIPSNSYPQKVQTMIAGGNGPDIMEVAENVNVYSSKGQLLKLDDYVSAAGLDLTSRFGPVGSLYNYKEATYAIPDRSGAMILYYNKKFFDSAGVPYPTAAWTWDDALSAFKELTKPGSRWGYSGANWWPQWWSLGYQNGGQIITPEGRPAVNSPEMVEALQWVGDLIYKHHVVPTAAEYADMGPDTGGDQAMVAGKVAVNTTGFWALSGLLSSDVDFDIAPVWRGKQQSVAAFGSGLAVSRDAKNPEQAFKAIQFLTDAGAQSVIINQAQDVPANTSVQSSPAFLKPTWAKRDINMSAFGESAQHTYTMPLIPEWNELQKAFDDGLANFWLGKATAQESLDRVQSQLERIVRS